MHVISLGSNCYCKSALDRAGYPGDPMPFDWLSTTLPMVQHCIEDNFAKLRDPYYFREVIRDGKTQIKHTGYVNHWDTTFTHYDPRSPMGAEYFQRSIDRWTAAMLSDEPKSLVFVSAIFPFEVDRYIGEIVRLNSAITACTRNATLCGVTVSHDQTNPSVSEREVHEGYVHYTSRSRMRGIRFEDEADDMAISKVIRRMVGAER